MIFESLRYLASSVHCRRWNLCTCFCCTYCFSLCVLPLLLLTPYQLCAGFPCTLHVHMSSPFPDLMRSWGGWHTLAQAQY